MELAFGDPNETTAGWTDAGHVVTGCSQDWIALRLVDENGDATPVFDDEVGDEVETSGSSGMETEPTPKPAPSGATSVVAGAAVTTFVSAVLAACVVFEIIV